MKFDDNEQMVAMLDHAKGSLENKIRQAYNSGYNDGFKAGVFEAWDDMREQLNKPLRQQIKKTEPQKIGYCNECKWFRDKQVCGRCRSKNMYTPKDEPQTDCAWKEPR